MGASDISLQQKKNKGGVWRQQRGVGMLEVPAEGMGGEQGWDVVGFVLLTEPPG